jgi:hypothetical protein
MAVKLQNKLLADKDLKNITVDNKETRKFG